jgi:hypothetical protein
MFKAPRCIRGLKSSAEDPLLDDVPKLGDAFHYFRLWCPKHYSPLRVLGYPIMLYPGDSHFSGPIAIECASCGDIVELMDPRKDGYDGEIGANANVTGDGPRQRWSCPKCKLDEFDVVVGFGYQFDSTELTPTEMERPEDFFDAFVMYGVCIKCHERSMITEMECA